MTTREWQPLGAMQCRDTPFGGLCRTGWLFVYRVESARLGLGQSGTSPQWPSQYCDRARWSQANRVRKPSRPQFAIAALSKSRRSGTAESCRSTARGAGGAPSDSIRARGAGSDPVAAVRGAADATAALSVAAVGFLAGWRIDRRTGGRAGDACGAAVTTCSVAMGAASCS